jgi:transketolase
VKDDGNASASERNKNANGLAGTNSSGESWKKRAESVAAGIRRRVLAHTLAHNGGYLSQACSSAEIFAALYTKILKLKPLDKPLMPSLFSGVPGPDHPAITGEAFNGGGDVKLDNFILSPAQYALVLYAALVETGRMDEEGMNVYNKDGGTVEMIGAEHSPGMELTTGSLGQGISQAAGIALARRIKQEMGRVIMFMSDGECESGEFWEAVQAASYHKLGNMLIYVDMNGFQCDGKRDTVMQIEPFDKRLESFGARVERISGHYLEDLVRVSELPQADTPTFVLCDTDPCRDMPVLKQRYPKFHYVRFVNSGEKEEYQKFLNTLNENADNPADTQKPSIEIRSKVHAKNLVKWSLAHPEVYVLSADLTGSCEADAFRDAYPGNFLSMGIAEQNMLSFAGGMARKGLVPLVHTFAVFIYRRAYDQIAMSIAYPNLPVKMFGFLPGVLTPGGATHQAIEDIAVMRALPNMTILEPGDALETEEVLEIAYRTPGPVYIRQLRGEVPVFFDGSEKMQLGKYRKLGSGKDLVLVTSGICTEEGLRAAVVLRAKGLSISHYHISTLKPFNHPDIVEEIAASRYGAVTLENHSIVGGLGSIIAEAMAEAGAVKPLRRLGIPDTFVHGASRRYLMKEYGLDAMALIAAAEKISGQQFGIVEEDLSRSFTPAALSAAKAEAL